MSDFSTSKVNKIIDVKVKNNNNNNNNNTIQKIFLDFDIIPYAVGLIIALSFHNLLKCFSKYIINDLIKINNDLLQALLEVILVLLFIYIIIYYIYYQFILTDETVKEKIMKHAIKEKKLEKAKKEIDNDKETKNAIENDIRLNKNETIEEYFTTKFYN